MSDQRMPGSLTSRRRRAGLATLTVCLGAAVAAPLVIGSDDRTPNPTARATSSSPAAATADCPRGARRLPPAGVPAAARAALSQARELYGADKNVEDVRVIQATWAPRATARGKYARVKCGARMQNRTVVVELEFPNEPGASLKQGIVLVSRVESGYDVWAVLH